MKPLVKALVDFPRASLVDIGANIGLYSLQAAAINRTSFAFEPFKPNYRRFCHSIHANKGFKNRIKRFNVAVMHESTNVKLQAGWRNQGGTRVVSYGKDETGKDIGGIAYAHGVTLDDMIKYLPKGQVVLKIDAEGAECKALVGGLEKYLQQIDIVNIAIEWSQKQLKECKTIR
jgi:FkbM family methyltransferase